MGKTKHHHAPGMTPQQLVIGIGSDLWPFRLIFPAGPLFYMKPLCSLIPTRNQPTVAGQYIHFIIQVHASKGLPIFYLSLLTNIMLRGVFIENNILVHSP